MGMMRIKPSVSKSIFPLVIFLGVAIYCFLVYFYKLEGNIGLDLSAGPIMLVVSLGSLILGFAIFSRILFSDLHIASDNLVAHTLLQNKVIPIKDIKSIDVYLSMVKGQGMRLLIKSEHDSLDISASDYKQRDISLFSKELARLNPSIALSDNVKSLIDNPDFKLRMNIPHRL